MMWTLYEIEGKGREYETWLKVGRTFRDFDEVRQTLHRLKAEDPPDSTYEYRIVEVRRKVVG